jgi:aldose 1-epimerase
VKSAPFGATPRGFARRFTLENAAGLRAELTDYGAALVSLRSPDRHGRPGDVVLGFDSAAEYAGHPFFLGATVGRFANRIAGGRFCLDGTTHQLGLNDGPPAARGHLHGGAQGFHTRLWEAEAVEVVAGTACRFRRRSPDGEEGYPGNLEVAVTYALAADTNDLRLDYEATTDRATPINLTHHSYFNLRGSGDVLGHRLRIQADRITPVGPALLPLGGFAAVAGTPFDFTAPRAIGERLHADDRQLRVAGGYDHNFVLTGRCAAPTAAAWLHDPASGRTLEVLTTEPGLQFYSGNFLDGSWPGKGGRPHGKHAGLCLEPQHFPDSPNRPDFPVTILRPGQIFRSTTIYRLRTDRPAA